MPELNVAYSWLLAGVFLLLVEAFGLPGTGVVFAGLGAITAGSAVYSGGLAPEDSTAQFIVFFISSALWAALLWKPMQKIRLGKKGSAPYSNIVGDTAYAGSAGITRHSGEATWSGTIMQARLEQGSAVDRLEAGSPATIVAVSGATLTVKPKA